MSSLKSNLIGVLILAALAGALAWIFVSNQEQQGADPVSGASVRLMVFGAKWCGPCVRMKPIVRELRTQLAGRLDVVEIDVDSSPELASRYNVSGIPCFVVLQGGKEISRQTGSMPKAQLRALVGL